LNNNLNLLSDEELVLEFQKNNTIESYEILVKRYKDPLMNYIFRYFGNRDIAADIVQDTMVKFYLNKDSYKSFAKFSTWIYTIAGNLAKNELKRRKRRTFISLGPSDDEKSVEIQDNSFHAPDIQADSSIKNEIIQKQLLKVNEAYRNVVILRDIQGLSYEEISEITGLTLGTVKSKINRGRLQLQKLLKNIYDR